MTTTLTQLAGSDGPMQFAVSAIDDTGSTIDPTVYPLYITFAAITSPPSAFSPQSATWYTTTVSWSVQAGNPNPVYWANVTPGPDGIPVTAGEYEAYVKIATAAPNGVVLLAAYCRFT